MREHTPPWPLESQWVVVDGQKLHMRVGAAREAADAPPVVFVHGMVVSGLYLVPTAERLAPDFRVYVPDLPGFGKSDKPWHVLTVLEMADVLARWMTAVGLERAALFGNSLGCQIIADFAMRYPDRVTRVVLQGPTVDPRARTAWQQIVRFLIGIPREPPRQGLIMLLDYLRAGPRRTVLVCRHMLRDRIEEKLPHVRVPAMVVRGKHDPIVPQRWAEEATRLLPDGRLRVIPGVAHAITIGGPLELVRVVRPFLNEDRRPASV